MYTVRGLESVASRSIIGRMEDDSGNHPSIGESFEIEQRAVKIFNSWLPDKWLARKANPDFFIDYLVETEDQGEPSGLHFAVQIKGTGATWSNSELRSHPFKTKHLRYYLERSLHPVFLFLINVADERGCWVFAQRYLRERVTASALVKNKYLTIQFVKTMGPRRGPGARALVRGKHI